MAFDGYRSPFDPRRQRRESPERMPQVNPHAWVNSLYEQFKLRMWLVLALTPFAIALVLWATQYLF